MTNDPMKPSEHEDELLAACDAFGPLKGEPGFRLEVSPDQARDLLTTIDALRARVDELESAPTDAEIEEWVKLLMWRIPHDRSSSDLLATSVGMLREIRDRAVALMRRRAAAEAGEASQLRQALGPLSTLAPLVQVDAADPLAMAQQIVGAVRARIELIEHHRENLCAQIEVLADVLLHEMKLVRKPNERPCEMAVRVLREQRQRIAGLESKDVGRVDPADYDAMRGVVVGGPESRAASEARATREHAASIVDDLRRSEIVGEAIVAVASALRLAGDRQGDYQGQATEVVKSILRAARGGAT